MRSPRWANESRMPLSRISTPAHYPFLDSFTVDKMCESGDLKYSRRSIQTPLSIFRRMAFSVKPEMAAKS